MNPILAGFHRLGRFSGRDSRAVFWPYAGLVLAAGFVTICIVMMLQMQALVGEIQAFAAQHPGRVTTEVGPNSYSMSVSSGDPAFAPDMSGMALGMGAVSGVLIVLLAAAVARRLHDTGRSGLWALPTAIFLMIALIMMPRLTASFSGPEPDMRLFGLLFANNAAYIFSLCVLIILLILPSRVGANRFGPPTA